MKQEGEKLCYIVWVLVQRERFRVGSKFHIRLSKPSLSPGHILLSDVATLGRGISRTLARLVQMHLGYPADSPLRPEALRASQLVLKGLSAGSALLECEPLDLLEVSGSHPINVSWMQLIEGINHYRLTSSWPDYLPTSVRHELGDVLRGILTEGEEISLEFQEHDGAIWHSCKLDAYMTDALLEEVAAETDVPVRVVGKMYGIDISNYKFKVDTQAGRVSVKFSPEQESEVDAVRWSRVFVMGLSVDTEYRRLKSMLAIRPAAEYEEDGIFPELEHSFLPDKSPLYQALAQRLDELTKLPHNWDSYNAVPPDVSTKDFVLAFIKDVMSSLHAYNIDLVEPDVIPTIFGGIQLEWEIENRGLELEILPSREFEFLRIDENDVEEGTVSRWEASQLIRWVITGDSV